MIEINTEKCTACGACVQRCPKNCISLKADENGFLMPKINITECISCDMCVRVCPVEANLGIAFAQQKAYAVVHKDKQALIRSTSGGAFEAIAEHVFSCGGVVYGVAYTEKLKVKHVRIESRSDFYRLNGSKYVQSDTNTTFIDAENDLKNGKQVLYSGTPCQIAGLKNFLGKEYENLITADIICHGVPSQNYFDKFVVFLSKNKKLQINDIAFRSKKNGGQSVSGVYSGVYSKTGKAFNKKFNYYDNYYYYYFLKSGIYRKCCYSCDYANLNRMGDFTLGDFWGAEGECLDFCIDDGCSLVLTNSVKAEKLLVSLNIDSKKISLINAVKFNEQLRSPSALPIVRDELLRQFREDDATIIQKYFKKKNRKAILLGRMKYLVPKKIKKFLLKKRYG
ncbi:MAG: coenzyme F420 hydrogenase [Collinsella tanakaei]|nr:MAG: coenzyme F420 hydrogenase [Collinsella tanakaei]